MAKFFTHPKKHENNTTASFLNIFEVPDFKFEVRIQKKKNPYSQDMTLIVYNCITNRDLMKKCIALTLDASHINLNQIILQ